MFRIEAELPSGTRISLQRDSRLWVASLASYQIVIREKNRASFEDRARLWCEANLHGVSLAIAYQMIRQFCETVVIVDAALDGMPARADARCLGEGAAAEIIAIPTIGGGVD